jgi:integrase
VTERLYRGERGAPKSRYGRREVPIPAELVRDLRSHRLASRYSPDGDPVFATRRGTPCAPNNLHRRLLKPAALRAGLVDEDDKPWPGFLTLRHTCATRLFLAGASAPQVQRWLGHHDPGFTLRTYVHLLPTDLPDAEILAGLVSARSRAVVTPGF